MTQAKVDLQQRHKEALAEAHDKQRQKDRELGEAINELQKLQLQIEVGFLKNLTSYPHNTLRP